MPKTSRSTTLPTPSCYEAVPNTTLGIAFEKQDGTKRFLPWSFLSAVDFNTPDELVFTFASGVVIVRGQTLGALWKAACKGELARVWESENPAHSEAVWVRELVFAESEPDSASSLPPFPRKL